MYYNMEEVWIKNSNIWVGTNRQNRIILPISGWRWNNLSIGIQWKMWKFEGKVWTTCISQ
jgi:hypothetical protein